MVKGEKNPIGNQKRSFSYFAHHLYPDRNCFFFRSLPFWNYSTVFQQGVRLSALNPPFFCTEINDWYTCPSAHLDAHAVDVPVMRCGIVFAAKVDDRFTVKMCWLPFIVWLLGFRDPSRYVNLLSIAFKNNNFLRNFDIFFIANLLISIVFFTPKLRGPRLLLNRRNWEKNSHCCSTALIRSVIFKITSRILTSSEKLA